MRYYVDTCIYLNLWQKETGRGGEKLWLFAQRFFERVEREAGIIVYSGFVLKELKHVLAPEEFSKKRPMFSLRHEFRRVFPSPPDYEAGRAFERRTGFRISFFDCMHVVLAKRVRAVLATRDERLLYASLGVWRAEKPEALTMH